MKFLERAKLSQTQEAAVFLSIFQKKAKVVIVDFVSQGKTFAKKIGKKDAGSFLIRHSKQQAHVSSRAN